MATRRNTNPTRRGRAPQLFDLKSIKRRATILVKYYETAGDAEQWAKHTLGNVRARAKKRGVICDLTKQDLFDMLAECGGRCPLTDIPFDTRRGQRCSTQHSVSVDRLDNAGGYTRSNTWLISTAANLAKGCLSLAALARLGNAAARMLKEQRHEQHQHPSGVIKHYAEATRVRRSSDYRRVA